MKSKCIILILIVLLFVSLSGCVEDSQPPTTLGAQKAYSDPDISDKSTVISDIEFVHNSHWNNDVSR